MGDLSAHFSRREFRCHHCGRLLESEELVRRLERLRSAIGRPIVILSGYRCPAHNARVGGVPNSFHTKGLAADLGLGVATVAEALAAGFTGIGYRRGWAVHVDVRPGPAVRFPD